MASATIVKTWKDSANAHIAIRVQETGGAVEYIATASLSELAGKTTAQQKAVLVAAAKAVRDAQINPETDMSITGTVTV